LCLRFEPVFRFFRSKIPSQTKPRTTTTAIGRITLIEPLLLTVSTVSWWATAEEATKATLAMMVAVNMKNFIIVEGYLKILAHIQASLVHTFYK
jgi:hypothetical protein